MDAGNSNSCTVHRRRLLVVGNTPQEFTAQTKAEFELYKGVVAKQKLKLD